MEKDILADARDAFRECVDAEAEQRARELDDLLFAQVPGHQWPEQVKRDRMLEGRPCLELNKMPAFIRQVVNDARQNKPAIKVHPADDRADPETAEVMSGIIRNIEYTSSADVSYDTGMEHAVGRGRGFWGVVNHQPYDGFGQELRIRRIANPFSVYGDPMSQEADSSDWNLAFVTETLKLSAFRRKYPGAEATSWEASRSDSADHFWFESDAVRIAEYWTRDEVEKNLLLLSDGTAILEESFLKPDENGLSMADYAVAEGVTVLRQRMTKCHRVKQCILSGAEILEDATDWPGIYIPIVPVYGEEVNVEGKRHYFSLIHRAKDAQTNFNVWRTAATEAVGLAPKAPFIGPVGAFVTDMEKWQTANVKSHPFLEYDGPVPPQRQPFAGIPAGALQEALNASDDMKAILGMYDASLGARSNETSGRAIMARQREGDTSTFHFIDNVTRAIRHTGRILIDLIPHFYGGERIVRIMGEDGTPQNVAINTQQEINGKLRRIRDISLGKYDLTVTAGPSFTTRREEAAFQMTEMIRAFPDSATVVGPHLAKNLDWPGAEEIARDLELISPVTAMKKQQQEAEAAAAQGLPPPPPPPDPKLVEVEKKLELEQAKLQGQAQLEQAKMQADMQKSAAQMQWERERSQQELALKKYEIDANLQIKAQAEAMKWEFAAMQSQMRQAPAATVQIDGKQELQGMSDTVSQSMAAIAAAVQAMAEVQQSTAQAASMLAGAAQVMAAPKRVVFNAEGRPVGVEPVTEAEQ